MLKRVLLAVTLAVPFLAIAGAQTQNRTITIGVADDGSQNMLLGNSICALINAGSPDHGILCSTHVRDTQAAAIEALRFGAQTLAVASSDIQYFAYEGRGAFEGRPMKELRSVVSVQPRTFTLVARKAGRIGALDDLKGRTLNIGNPGSVQRSLMERVIEVKGWTMDDFSSVLELRPQDQIAALCEGKADAAVFASAHPDPLIERALRDCDASVVPFSEREIAQVIDDNPYLIRTEFPFAHYGSEEDDAATFGLRWTLLAAAEADRGLVYEATKIIFDNFERLKQFDPAFSRLDREDMIRSGLTAPLHPGARRYFREKGLR